MEIPNFEKDLIDILSIKIDMEKFTSSKLGQLCSKAYQEGYEQALKDIKNNVR